MTSDKPAADLAVIQVNYERPSDTIECIRSLQQSRYPHLRIVLVDNGSQDNSVELLKEEFPELPLICIPKNIKFTGGHNAGIRAALETGATHVFILNNDTILDPDTIPCLMQAMENDHWDVVVPKIVYYDDPQIIWSAGAHYRSFPPGVVMNGLLKPDAPRYNRAGPLDYATGCAFIARREVFDVIGGFDDDFGLYNDDWDFFYRLKHAGFKTGYIPQARILHKVSRTLGRYPAGQRFYIARNSVLFFRKQNRFPVYVVWLHIAWILVREALKGRAADLKDYWQGFQEGFRVMKRLNSR